MLARNKLQAAIETLQANPLDLGNQDALTKQLEEVKIFDSRKLEGQKVRSRLKWRKVGDSCSKAFFQAIRERSTASYISKLCDKQGNTHSNQAQFELVCRMFYSELYALGVDFSSHSGAIHQALVHVQPRVSLEFQNPLSTPLTLHELGYAMNQMQSEKALGYDGVILEFFKEFWDIIGHDYHTIVRDSLTKGRFPPGVTKGLVALLFKARDRKLLGNLRPITLLTVS